MILLFCAVNEFSYLYRAPQSVAQNRHLYSRHYNLTARLPFVGSYFLMAPETIESGTACPAVVVLRGISRRVYAAEYLAQQDYRRRYPAYVIVPSLPERAFWIRPRDGDYAPPQMIPYPDHMPQVMAMIGAVVKDNPVDPRRIYLTGHSMGGMGVVGALQACPGMFAAGLALSGTWNPAKTDQIRSPLWMIHGGSDPQIPASFSRLTAQRLRARQAAIRYDEIPGQGHDIWKIVYPRPEAWDWLFSHGARTAH